MPEVSVSVSHWHRPDRTKLCIDCRERKTLSAFYPYAYTTKQGKRSVRYESRCKKCSRARRKQQTVDRPGYNAVVARAWREANPDKAKELRRRYQASAHGKRVKAKNQRMRKAKLKARAIGSDPRIGVLYDEATMLQAKLRACVESDDPLELQIHVDHKMPLARGGKHVFDNLQLLSGRENVDKGVKTHSVWAGGRDA